MSKGIIIREVEVDISNLEDTKRLARIIAQTELCDGDVLLLDGGLGAGKTEFSRSLIREIVDDEELVVPSPTFTIVQGYDFIDPPIFHFDFYRINHLEDAHEVGIEEALSDGISIIEWPSKIDGWYFKDPLMFKFSTSGHGADKINRKVIISMSLKWVNKLYQRLQREFILND